VKISSSKPNKNFYEWVNSAWLSKAKIPAYETGISVSDELEECIAKKLETLLLPKTEGVDPFDKTIALLSHSALTSRVQHTSVDMLHKILGTLNCIEAPEDLARHLGSLANVGISSLFSLTLTVLPSNRVQLCISPNPAGVDTYDRTMSYRHMLRELGNELSIPDLETILPFERRLNTTYDKLYLDTPPQKTSIRKLSTRFPSFAWRVWYEAASGEPCNPDTVLYVRNIPYLTFLMRQLKTVPLSLWRLYLTRIYVVHAVKYLPPPFDVIHFNYFGRILRGQREKMPQKRLFLTTVMNYLTHPLSHKLWDTLGDPARLRTFRIFTQKILDAAKERMDTVEWMHPATRVAAAAKLDATLLELARPRAWEPYVAPQLDERCFLKNIYQLGRWNMQQNMKRIGKPYMSWEEGIFTVNAYYFNENNEIMIPYATILKPFYDEDAPLGWNYGSIGATIGHELCHGFDNDGKDYDPKGQHKVWWKPADLRAYKRTTRRLIRLYNKQRVLGRPVNGSSTLSENIADIGGVGIALDALKKDLSNLSTEARRRALQTFFIAYAVSWRTKTRPEKTRTALLVDKHAPAELRVNLVVNQFDEFYEAFGIVEGDPMWRAPAARIRIF
jgi:predicted metalloendopeptidase